MFRENRREEAVAVSFIIIIIILKRTLKETTTIATRGINHGHPNKDTTGQPQLIVLI